MSNCTHKRKPHPTKQRRLELLPLPYCIVSSRKTWCITLSPAKESSSLIHGSSLGSKNFQYQASFGLKRRTTLCSLQSSRRTAAINKRMESAYVGPISRIRENLLQHPSGPLPPPKPQTTTVVPNHKSIGEIASESLGFIVSLCVVSKRPRLICYLVLLLPLLFGWGSPAMQTATWPVLVWGELVRRSWTRKIKFLRFVNMCAFGSTMSSGVASASGPGRRTIYGFAGLQLRCVMSWVFDLDTYLYLSSWSLKS